MTVKNKTNKNYKRSQRGRSMVEMLGVLAIVGVLSVGGVYGYGVAMKKHKANELLHQASMLATTISAQIQSKGELPQSIEDFGNGKYGEFKEPEKANDEQFSIQITDMDSAVCEQVAKMSGGMVRKAECDGTTLTLTYNNNLSSDKVAADYNGKQDECEASGRKYCVANNACVSKTQTCPVNSDSCRAENKKWCSGNNKCVDKGTSCCADVTLNTCLKACDSSDGTLTYEYEGIPCDLNGTKDGVCLSGVCAEIPSTCDANNLPGCLNTDDCEDVGGVMRRYDDFVICQTKEDAAKMWCDSMDAEIPNHEDFWEMYCCKDGWELDDGGFILSTFVMEVPICGCPSGTEPVVDGETEACCQTDSDYKGYGGKPGDDSVDYWYPEICGCPEGRDLAEEYGEYFCCDEDGFACGENGCNDHRPTLCQKCPIDPETGKRGELVECEDETAYYCLSNGKATDWQGEYTEDPENMC